MHDSQIIILTKFNIRSNATWTRSALDPAWLEQRFQLFEMFCLPSVLAQDDDNFTWIIFFDEETPEPFVSKAKELSSIKNIRILFTPPPDRLALRKAIIEHVSSEFENVVTCRLDNDDGLARDYIARLRNTAATTDTNSFINFRFGMILAKKKLYLQNWPDNAFCAFKEPIPTSPETFQTVWNTAHTHILENHSVVQILGPPGWLQVVHGSNVSNKLRGYRVHPSEIDANFELSKLQLEHKRGFSFYWDRLVMRAAWLTRDKLLKSIKQNSS